MNSIVFITSYKRFFIENFDEVKFTEWVEKEGDTRLNIGEQICYYLERQYRRKLLDNENVVAFQHNLKNADVRKYTMLIAAKRYHL